MITHCPFCVKELSLTSESRVKDCANCPFVFQIRLSFSGKIIGYYSFKIDNYYFRSFIRNGKSTVRIIYDELFYIEINNYLPAKTFSGFSKKETLAYINMLLAFK